MTRLGCRALLANRKEVEIVSGHSPEPAVPTCLSRCAHGETEARAGQGCARGQGVSTEAMVKYSECQLCAGHRGRSHERTPGLVLSEPPI